MTASTPEMVAILMTDLVGSTAMADRVGPAVAEQLRSEHFALLRGALERAGGREVKNLGDGLMVVFSSASQALACAVAMQQAVEARNRRAEEQLARRAARPNSNSISRGFAALALINCGRGEEARELCLVEDFQSVPWDWMWLLSIFLWADACCALGLGDRAQELYELLTPFANMLAVSGTLVAGSIDWALGALATTLERYEQAEAHFAAAAEIEERFGAPLFVARTRTGWARALIARGRPEDLERAQQMLEQAEETAVRLGGGLVAGEVADCRAALAALSG